MNRRHTFDPSELGKEGHAPSRYERRFQAKQIRRALKRRDRAALHGRTGSVSAPSLLQALRQAGQIQREREKVDELLAFQESASDAQERAVSA